MRIKDTDTFVDLSKEDKDALDTWAHYCKQHEGYERNEIWEGDIISSPHFERVATVKWDDSLCGFKCSDVTGNINFSFTAIAHCSEWSIVGNKFDKKK